MANLEVKSKMSALQLGAFLIMVIFGGQFLLFPQRLISQAEHGVWLSLLLAGLVFYTVAFLMCRLGKYFPDQTLVEYMPILWGRVGAKVILGWLLVQLVAQCCLVLYESSRAITFFLLDRTPNEVVLLGTLGICIYCALQDFGTILRITQFLFFITLAMLFGVWSLCIFNFQPENLLPLWPINTRSVVYGAFNSWTMYSGYEILLLLLPMVNRGKISFAKVLGGVFGFTTLAFIWICLTIIGVVTVEGVKHTPYPALLAIRSVELPGTFIERMEVYLLLAWIPMIFIYLANMIYFTAQIGMRMTECADHRPWVLSIIPIVYFGGALLKQAKIYEVVSDVALYLGLGFSLVIIPVSLILVRRKKIRLMLLQSCNKGTD